MGQNFVGQDVAGAKSLGQVVMGQKVLGQEVGHRSAVVKAPSASCLALWKCLHKSRNTVQFA